MNTPNNVQVALDELLLKTTCKKRKVACVITYKDEIIGQGFNKDFTAADGCGDESDKNRPGLKHAEIMALDTMYAYGSSSSNTPDNFYSDAILYVTHEPCNNCAKAISKAGITNVVVSQQFMKFDAGKLRYSLIPPEATKSLAEVLTYGAKKYKPNNWREVDNTERYWDALYRHLEARRAGEDIDKESGLSHLSHAITNIAFLITLEDQN